MTRRCEWCAAPLPLDAPSSKITCNAAERALRHRWLNDVHRAGGRPPVSPPQGSPLLQGRVVARCVDCGGEARSVGGAPAVLRHAPTCPNRKPSKPSGLQVSYRKAVDEVADAIEELCPGMSAEGAREFADDALRRALSDRQRERLEARG